MPGPCPLVSLLSAKQLLLSSTVLPTVLHANRLVEHIAFHVALVLQVLEDASQNPLHALLLQSFAPDKTGASMCNVFSQNANDRSHLFVVLHSPGLPSIVKLHKKDFLVSFSYASCGSSNLCT